MFCNNSSILNIIFFIKTLISIAGIIVPVLMIILMVIDALKAVSGNYQTVDKSLKASFQRILFASLFFFIPLFVNLFIGIIASTTGFNKDNFITCLADANYSNIEYQKNREAALKAALKEEKKRDYERHQDMMASIKKSRSEIEKQTAKELALREETRRNRLARENALGEAKPDRPLNGEESSFNPSEKVEGNAQSYRDIVYDPSDVTKVSNIRSDQLAKLIKANPKLGKLLPYVDGLVTMENKYKVNIFFLMGIQIQESGWYNSKLARVCNNFGGIKKAGGSPCSVAPAFRYFSTPTAFFEYQANLLGTKYLTPGASYYKGKSIKAVNQSYCPVSDGGCSVWTQKVNKIASLLFNDLRRVL